MDSSNNYHLKIIFDEGEINNTIEIYKRNEKTLATYISSETKRIEFTNGQLTDLYIENNNKIVKEKSSIEPTLIKFANIETIYSNDMKNILHNCFFTNIESTNYRGIECFLIKNFSSYSIVANNKGNNIIYLNKENGLPVRILECDNRIDFIYEFNTVTDKDVDIVNLLQ